MVLFQNQVMRGKEVFLKKINKIFIILFCGYMINLHILTEVVASENNLKKNIINYFKNIDEFSSLFFQSSAKGIEEGELFLKNKRIRIQYLLPSNILIIVAEKKAMYFNQDLEEVEYFNPQKTIANVFFKFFYDQSFFDNSVFKEKENSIIIEKNIKFDNDEIFMKIYFEKSPLILRKLEIKNIDGITSYSIVNPNFNPILNKKLFSLANPTLN